MKFAQEVMTEEDRIVVSRPLYIKGVGHTNGKGLWSKEVKTIPFTLELPGRVYCWWDEDFKVYGHAHANFSTRKWDTWKHGLIYTDKQFIKDVQKTLKEFGVKNYNDIHYSEQGMQGDNYVDMDIGDKLIKELIKNEIIVVLDTK